MFFCLRLSIEFYNDFSRVLPLCSKVLHDFYHEFIGFYMVLPLFSKVLP